MAATAVLLWTKIRCALAEPAKCRKLVRDNSTSAAASGLGFGERYVNLVHCGNFSLLISRLQPNLREFEWITIARPWINGRAGGAARLLPRSWHLSHNAATVCVNDTLHVFGGQYRNYSHGRGEHARGVFHASAEATLQPGAVLHWGSKSLQLEGYHSGCVERRSKFAGYCEFDGQFSAVYFRGRFLLYARANMAPSGGARHVQVASAPADLSAWSPFRTVQLPGVKAGRTDSNIYFFNVQVWGDQLLALFPAVFPAAGSAGIYASTSTDGVAWTTPQRLMQTAAACSRTRVHPIRLVDDQLYLLNNVDISEPADIPAGHSHVRGATRPYIRSVRVDFQRQTFLGLDILSQSTTFRLHDDKWHDVQVQGTGDANALGRVRLTRTALLDFKPSMDELPKAERMRVGNSPRGARQREPRNRTFATASGNGPYMCVLSGATKRSHHVRTEVQPRLHEVADQLYLFSFILPVDSVMMSHWLRHYHSLGVRPSHTNVAIRVDPGTSEESQQGAALKTTLLTLHSAGVPRTNVQVLYAEPSDELKRSSINALMDSVPKDSWFIYADSDELFDYPCNISPHDLKKVPCMAGMMWDQLANNGNISEAQLSPSLHEQFPLVCRIRSTAVPKMNPVKNIISNVGGGRFAVRRFRNTHALNSTCQLLGIVRHYSMTGQQLANNGRGRDVQPKQKKASTFGKGTAVDPAPLNYANGTCGNPNPRTGACMDYALLLKFMRKQVARVAANGTAPPPTHLCPRNLTHDLFEKSYEDLLSGSPEVSADDKVTLERAELLRRNRKEAAALTGA